METIWIDKILSGGEADQGNNVFFDLLTRDGRTIRVFCTHNYLGAIITFLFQFGAIAAEVRGPRGEFFTGTTEIIPKHISVHPRADGSGIGLEIEIETGVSWSICLPLETVPQLRKSLRVQAEEARRLARRRQH